MGTDIHVVVQECAEGDWRTIRVPEHVWAALNDRNYELFSVLADVRNGDGHTVKPIDSPRGLPNDPDPDESWWVDHSPSFVSVEELVDYPWHEMVPYWGLVSREDYWSWHWRAEGDGPPSWCQRVGGMRTSVISEQEMRDLGKPSPGELAEPRHFYYTRCEWQTPASQAVGRFYSVALPWLAHEAKARPMRLVFGFA